MMSVQSHLLSFVSVSSVCLLGIACSGLSNTVSEDGMECGLGASSVPDGFQLVRVVEETDTYLKGDQIRSFQIDSDLRRGEVVKSEITQPELKPGCVMVSKTQSSLVRNPSKSAVAMLEPHSLEKVVRLQTVPAQVLPNVCPSVLHVSAAGGKSIPFQLTQVPPALTSLQRFQISILEDGPSPEVVFESGSLKLEELNTSRWLRDAQLSNSVYKVKIQEENHALDLQSTPNECALRVNRDKLVINFGDRINETDTIFGKTVYWVDSGYSLDFKVEGDVDVKKKFCVQPLSLEEMRSLDTVPSRECEQELEFGKTFLEPLRDGFYAVHYSAERGEEKTELVTEILGVKKECAFRVLEPSGDVIPLLPGSKYCTHINRSVAFANEPGAPPVPRKSEVTLDFLVSISGDMDYDFNSGVRLPNLQRVLGNVRLTELTFAEDIACDADSVEGVKSSFPELRQISGRFTLDGFLSGNCLEVIPPLERVGSFEVQSFYFSGAKPPKDFSFLAEVNDHVVIDESFGLPRFSNLRKIGGKLEIRSLTGEAPLDLSGFSALEEVGALRLLDTAAEISLEGLRRGLQLHSLKIRHVPNLKNLKGLSAVDLAFVEQGAKLSLELYDVGLESLEGIPPFVALKELEMSELPNLPSLQGLENLREAGGLYLSDMVMTDLDALLSLEKVSDLVVARIPLKNLDSLRNLRQANCVSLTQMPTISSLTGLSRLTELVSLQLGMNSVDGEGGEASPLTNLAGLQNLRSIGGHLNQCNSTPSEINSGGLTILFSGIRNLEELSNLRRLDGLTLVGNSNLESLHGLEGIRELPDGLEVFMGHESFAFAGLEAVERLGTLLVGEFENEAGFDLRGLRNLKSVEPVRDPENGIATNGEVFIYNTNLLSLRPLANLERVGSLIFAGVSKLRNLEGLESLRLIESPTGGELKFEGLPDLESVFGLNSELKLGGLRACGVPQVTDWGFLAPHLPVGVDTQKQCDDGDDL